MTARTVLPALAVSALLAAPYPAASQATDWKAIPKPPLRPFQPQQPRRIALPNGLVIFLQEDHELPLVRGFARIRGGSREEPAAKTGLVSIYGQAWRTGGSKKRSGDDLDDFLEARAAKVETGGGLDSTAISFDCLKGNFDEVFAVFLELLKEPEFREDKIVLAKSQMTTAIARRNDQAQGIASREARRLGYGADSPYGRLEEYATVAAVTRDDLLGWHKATVHPNNILMGIVGDFDSRKIEATLRKALGSWPKGPAVSKVQATFKDPKPGIYFVAKDDVNQSNVRMVHLGMQRDNPDYHAIVVMNEVFGGGFSARLFSNVRSKKGLAYAVGGGVGFEYDYPGLLTVSVGTKSETTAAAIQALYEEIDNLLKTPATEDELKRAKDNILNSFVFRLDSKDKVLREKMLYEFYGYPLDFLERFPVGIGKVTAEDVARVARKYVHKEKLAVLVVGKADDFDKPLTTFGPVTAVDITIPEPGAEKKASAEGSNPEGKALLAKVVEGLGGASSLKAVKSYRQKASVHARTPQGEMNMETETVAIPPDRMLQRMHTPMGTVTMVLSPAASFVITPGGVQDMPASQKESGMKDIKTHPLVVAQRVDDPKLTARVTGSEKVGDVDAKVLELNLDGTDTRWVVDPGSGHILRVVAHLPGGQGEQVVDYSDWRAVQGVQYPFKRRISRGGEDAGSVEVLELELNPTVDPKAFEKPATPPPPKP